MADESKDLSDRIKQLEATLASAEYWSRALRDRLCALCNQKSETLSIMWPLFNLAEETHLRVDRALGQLQIHIIKNNGGIVFGGREESLMRLPPLPQAADLNEGK